jgi:hypothetical protein
MHIVSSCPPPSPSPSNSKNLASSMLKNLYVPKKSNENKKEEAATCDTTWQAAVALSLSLSLSHHHCHTTSQPSSSGLSLNTPSPIFSLFFFHSFLWNPTKPIHTTHRHIFNPILEEPYFSFLSIYSPGILLSFRI